MSSAVGDEVVPAGGALAAPVARLTERWGALYADEYPALARYAYRLTGDPDTAAEIAQEAFTRLLGRWVGVREPHAYLFRVATNLARDRWARRGREVAADAEPPHEAGVTGPDVTVTDAVARLPARHRDVVLLHYFADLPVPEVAAALRRPPGTVKRLLYEARAQLAIALGDHDD